MPARHRRQAMDDLRPTVAVRIERIDVHHGIGADNAPRRCRCAGTRPGAPIAALFRNAESPAVAAEQAHRARSNMNQETEADEWPHGPAQGKRKSQNSDNKTEKEAFPRPRRRAISRESVRAASRACEPPVRRPGRRLQTCVGGVPTRHVLGRTAHAQLRRHQVRCPWRSEIVHGGGTVAAWWRHGGGPSRHAGHLQAYGERGDGIPRQPRGPPGRRERVDRPSAGFVAGRVAMGCRSAMGKS